MKNVLVAAIATVIFFLQACRYEGSDACGRISFSSTDFRLESAFQWAKQQALDYVGDSSDPVGPWYEAALPGREAFCMRDVSHQCIGAEILGLTAQNRNMIKKFAQNISGSKDWCTYWEINRYDQPAPVDYRNDQEFWYNLPANYDLTDACLRLYQWAGNPLWYNDPELKRFFKITLNDYTDHWQLQPELLMQRERFLHVPEPFDAGDAFHVCRGLPSYVESVTDLRLGADLLAAAHAGFVAGAEMENLTGNPHPANEYAARAEQLKDLLNKAWWDSVQNRYRMFLYMDGQFGFGEGEIFLLRYGIAAPGERTDLTLQHLLDQQDYNIETRSYLPMIYYNYGLYDQAYRQIMILTDPATQRREYPEVSFAVIESMVAGMMGVEPDAGRGIITTRSRIADTTSAEIECLPVMGAVISLSHTGARASAIRMENGNPFTWKACLKGRHKKLLVNGELRNAKLDSDATGRIFSYVLVHVEKPGKFSVEIPDEKQ